MTIPFFLISLAVVPSMSFSVSSAANSTVAMQEPVSELGPIAKCRDQFDDPFDRIACLEEAIGLLTDGPTSAQSARNESNEGSPGKNSSPTLAQSNSADDAERGRPARGTARPSTGIVISETETVPETSKPTVTGLGAEQVIARTRRQSDNPDDRRPEEFKAAIEDFRIDQRGLLTVLLEDGQIWKQAFPERRPVRLRKGRSYTAIIKRGALSGYALTIPETDDRIRVDRLK